MRKIQVLASLCLMLVFVSCGTPGKVIREEPKKGSQQINPVHDQMKSRFLPVEGTKGMIVSDDRIASQWGADILKRGGNAVDAAVATAFALAVTRPHYGSIGGGGFMVYCPRPSKGYPGKCEIIDYREMAPAAAYRNMYLRGGRADTALSQKGGLASGVPGVVSGLLMAQRKWGRLTRQKVLARPINLARNGVPMSSFTEVAAKYVWKKFNDEAKRIFGCAKGRRLPTKPCQVGQTLRQRDLANVLKAISARGEKGFYAGWVAKKIIEGLNEKGGVFTSEDLWSYQSRVREPVAKRYRKYEIVSMPPPSAGGTTMLQMFEYADLADRQGALSDGFGSAKTVHALAHGMALSFADRAKHFGDPEFYQVPVQKLLSSEYLSKRWNETYSEGRFSPPVDAGVVELKEGDHTTHFSVVDRWGNMVSVTTTVNFYFGSGLVPKGTGIVMNNEMDDFSLQPGVPNGFGLVGAEANSVAAQKRPLSSMSPTIVRDLRGNNLIAIGAAGGPKITTSVFLALLNRLRFGMSLVDAVAAPRIHYQWKPKFLWFEKFGLSPETVSQLTSMGYAIKERSHSGVIHALERLPNGRVWGVPDRRAEGAAVAQ